MREYRVPQTTTPYITTKMYVRTITTSAGTEKRPWMVGALRRTPAWIILIIILLIDRRAREENRDRLRPGLLVYLVLLSGGVNQRVEVRDRKSLMSWPRVYHHRFVSSNVSAVDVLTLTVLSCRLSCQLSTPSTEKPSLIALADCRNQLPSFSAGRTWW